MNELLDRFHLRPLRAGIKVTGIALVASLLCCLMWSAACHKKQKDWRLTHAEAEKLAESMNAQQHLPCGKWAVRDHPDGTAVVYLDESGCKKIDAFKEGFKAVGGRDSQ
jgi:hypothetical protein